MKTAHEIMSLSQYTASNISEHISKQEQDIKDSLSDVFDDVQTCENVGQDLVFLARMKDARLLMATSSYKAYEKEGKPMPYEEYLVEWHNSL